jgi:hypothetical protein
LFLRKLILELHGLFIEVKRKENKVECVGDEDHRDDVSDNELCRVGELEDGGLLSNVLLEDRYVEDRNEEGVEEDEYEVLVEGGRDSLGVEFVSFVDDDLVNDEGKQEVGEGENKEGSNVGKGCLVEGSTLVLIHLKPTIEKSDEGDGDETQDKQGEVNEKCPEVSTLVLGIEMLENYVRGVGSLLQFPSSH